VAADERWRREQAERYSSQVHPDEDVGA